MLSRPHLDPLSGPRFFKVSLSTLTCLRSYLLLIAMAAAPAADGLTAPVLANDLIDISGDQLPGSAPLKMPAPLYQVMTTGISKYADRMTIQAREARTAPWLPGASGAPPEMSIQEARQKLRTMIGAVDPMIERPAYWVRQQAGREDGDQAIQYSLWEVLEGVHGEGISLNAGTAASNLLILLPDPEFSLDHLLKLGGEAARFDLQVEIPLLVDRKSEFSGHPDIRWTNLPHREFVYRASFELGRHPIGFEVQKVWGLARYWKQRNSDGRVFVAGFGEGGLLALMAGTSDEPLIDGVCISGYFGPREQVYAEPIYRNLFGQLKLFGDAEIASLVSARTLLIDGSPAPEVTHPTTVEGVASVAAPGRIRTPGQEQLSAEVDRVLSYAKRTDALPEIVWSRGNGTSPNTFLADFLRRCNVQENSDRDSLGSNLTISESWHASARKRQLEELLHHTQRLLHRSDKVRATFWSKADRTSLDGWEKTSAEYREYVHRDLIGRLPESSAEFNLRTQKVIDEATHAGYEVVLDVIPSPEQGVEDWGVIAGGILLLPKDLKPGEQRPVVVCQHGLEGVPMDTITMDETERAWAAYKGFSTQLVKQGYIVYAPQNPYKGYDDFRVLQRKSNPLGLSLFSYIIEQHRQTLKWLAKLPNVDPQRIAFYGLSYGGKTAVRVPPLLPPRGDFPGYCLSICSADFNEWIRKNVSVEDRYSYVFTPEYEMFEWNMGHVADYAELSTLMTPRPFMVERGHNDGVAPDEWVAWEYAKVRRHYDQLGIGDRTEIEWFNGPHTINGQGTFRFLKKHLAP